MEKNKEIIDKKANKLIKKALYIRLASVLNPEYLNYWKTLESLPIDKSNKTILSSNWDENVIQTNIKCDRNFKLSFRVNGSGLVLIDNEPYAGIDQYHNIIDIPAGSHEITVFYNSRGLFGNIKSNPGVMPVIQFIQNNDLETLYLKVLTAIDYALLYEDMEELNSIERIIGNLPPFQIHTLSYEIYRSYFDNNVTASDMYRMLESIPDYDARTGSDFKTEIEDISQKINQILSKYSNKHSKVKIIPIGHAHIDLAWLWPVSETKRKVVRTFSTVLNLMDRNYNFNFVQSMAWHYKFIEEYDKKEGHALFERIKKAVKLGKWIPVGGMMVESDCNLISGESFVRQILYGQYYFKENFGKYTNICWLPDTFGFGPQLPQILSNAGYDFFFTTKMSWNDTNRFPHDLFLWEALDGSRIVAHSHMRTYNSDITPGDIMDSIKLHPETAKTGKVPIVFGYGDGGGGPTDEMLETMNIMDPENKIFINKVDGLQNWITQISKMKEELPVYSGELYLEYHRGTYTTHGDIKKANREVESILYIAEAIEVLVDYNNLADKDGYRSEWETALKNQFHDILPGTAIKEVYDVAVPEMAKLKDSIYRRILMSSEKSNDGISIFNPYPWKNISIVELPPQILLTDCMESNDGSQYEVFNINGKPNAIITFDKGMGFYNFKFKSNYRSYKNIKEDDSSSKLVLGDWIININEDDISEIKYKGRKLSVPEIRIFSDFPSMFDAWELEKTERTSGRLISPEGTRVTQNDGKVITLEQSFLTEPGDLTLKWTFIKDIGFCNMDFTVDWKGNNRTLKMFFETGSGTCLGEVAFGHAVRSNHNDAQFEFPAHRFVSVLGEDSFFSILNREKYGYSFDGNYLGATLLRSPMYPDPTADRGINKFSFSISNYPMNNDELHKKAIEYNILPVIMQGIVNSDAKLLIDNAILSSLKRAENGRGFIIRIYNPVETARDFKIHTPFSKQKAEICNILEESIQNSNEISIKGSMIEGKLGPFKILSLRILP